MAGLETVMAVEHIKSCVDTYKANHPDVHMFESDVRKVTDEMLKKEMKARGISSIDVVSAGFPCETFSTAGSKSRVYDDHRNQLYKEAIRLALAANARILLLENVPAFLSKKIAKDSDKKIVECLIEDLNAAGFVYNDYAILNSSDYGVPQNRSRFIMLASREIPIDKSLFNQGKTSQKITVMEALADLPHIAPGSQSEVYARGAMNPYQKLMRELPSWLGKAEQKLSYHMTTKHRPTTIERFKLISPGEGLRDLFEKLGEKKVKLLQGKGILPKKWYTQRNQRLHPNKPSITVTSHCLDEILHPQLQRSLSVREAARLQSFPDWYDFKGGPLVCPHVYKTQDKYEQIGDAVPPLLAKHIGQAIVSILDGSQTSSSSSIFESRDIKPIRDRKYKKNLSEVLR